MKILAFYIVYGLLGMRFMIKTLIYFLKPTIFWANEWSIGLYLNLQRVIYVDHFLLKIDWVVSWNYMI